MIRSLYPFQKNKRKVPGSERRFSYRVLSLQIFAFKKTSRFYKTGTGFVRREQKIRGLA
jgi:hypothetical protein